MSTKFPGGLVRSSGPTIVGPVGGEGGSAPGVWTLEQASYYTKQGVWPLPLKQGGLWAWGQNSQGQLGQNNLIYRSSPVQVGADASWRKIATGQSSALAIKTNGTLWAWGSNNHSQLCISVSGGYRLSPVQVGALTTWATVKSGEAFTLAVKTDGTLWSCGWNNEGQLGLNLGSTEKSSPTQIGALTNWASVTCGGAAALAVKTDGSLWAWGNNADGGLGVNNKATYSSPIQVGALTDWGSISAGGTTSNGFSVGVKTNGTLWSWGYNGYGQLGQNNTIFRSSPVQVGALTTWSNVACGYSHVIAIKTDGTLWTWGDNNSGQLGQNNAINCSSPVQVGALAAWQTISAGFYSTAATKTNGTLWLCGNPNYGKLGQNNLIYRSSPTQVGSGTTWTAVATNGNFTLGIS